MAVVSPTPPSPTANYNLPTIPTLPPIPSDWATYSTGDFSIRYPADWQATGTEGEFAVEDGFVRVRKAHLPDVGELLPHCIVLANFGVTPLKRGAAET
jgi:hypothetical protein